MIDITSSVAGVLVGVNIAFGFYLFGIVKDGLVKCVKWGIGKLKIKS